MIANEEGSIFGLEQYKYKLQKLEKYMK